MTGSPGVNSRQALRTITAPDRKAIQLIDTYRAANHWSPICHRSFTGAADVGQSSAKSFWASTRKARFNVLMANRVIRPIAGKLSTYWCGVRFSLEVLNTVVGCLNDEQIANRFATALADGTLHLLSRVIYLCRHVPAQ